MIERIVPARQAKRRGEACVASSAMLCLRRVRVRVRVRVKVRVKG